MDLWSAVGKDVNKEVTAPCPAGLEAESAAAADRASRSPPSIGNVARKAKEVSHALCEVSPVRRGRGSKLPRRKHTRPTNAHATGSPSGDTDKPCVFIGKDQECSERERHVGIELLLYR